MLPNTAVTAVEEHHGTTVIQYKTLRYLCKILHCNKTTVQDTMVQHTSSSDAARTDTSALFNTVVHDNTVQDTAATGTPALLNTVISDTAAHNAAVQGTAVLLNTVV
jgi:hypothetical protein